MTRRSMKNKLDLYLVFEVQTKKFRAALCCSGRMKRKSISGSSVIFSFILEIESDSHSFRRYNVETFKLVTNKQASINCERKL